MSLIIWSCEFETGIAAVDRQHRRIVDYINQLNSSAASAQISSLLNELLEYTLSHFTFEECLMEDSGFTGCQEHRESHNGFREQLEYMLDHETSATELLNFLQNWLIDHILTEDQQYVSSVTSHYMTDAEQPGDRHSAPRH